MGMCSDITCDRPTIARGLCTKHYQRAVKSGSLPPALPVRTHCQVDECNRPRPYRHGYCDLHWQRVKAHGSTDPRTADDRFDAKWTLDPSTGCHIWTAAKHNGYGWFNVDHRPMGAHVYAYVRRYGPVPEGLVLDHFVCDNPPCCNPDHVRPATVVQNVMRSPINLFAVNRRKTHCIHGHEFTEANTYRPPKRPEHRQCRTCIKIRTERKAPNGH